MVVFEINIYHWIIIDAKSMYEYTQKNSLRRKIDTDDNIKMNHWYMEPNNDISKACLNKIDNTE